MDVLCDELESESERTCLIGFKCVNASAVSSSEVDQLCENVVCFNGVCQGGTCVCNPGFTGATCQGTDDVQKPCHFFLVVGHRVDIFVLFLKQEVVVISMK